MRPSCTSPALLATPPTPDASMCPVDPNDPSDAAARLSSRVHDALLLAATELRETTEALRDAVCDYVEDGRRRGIPLDEMTASVKLLVARLRHAGAIPRSHDAPDILVEQLVAWCGEFGGEFGGDFGGEFGGGERGGLT